MKSKAIVIVGMHRSGTSAVSGMLSELGVFMGGELFGPQKGVNDKGFYENSVVVDINEQLLDKFLWSWDDPMAESCAAPAIPYPQNIVDDAVDRIKKDYSGQSNWGMKDPRTSLFIPFWDTVLRKIDSEPYYLLMIRNPAEVAGSLSKRDNFSLEKSIMIWLNYTFSSYFQCRGRHTVIISYDQLLADPAKCATRVQKAFDLPIEVRDGKVSFIDKKLKNQSKSLGDATILERIASGLYEILQNEDCSEQEVQKLYDEYQTLKQGMSAVLIEHLESVKRSEVHFRTVFEDAYYSLWWKLSRPFKKLEEFVKK